MMEFSRNISPVIPDALRRELSEKSELRAIVFGSASPQNLREFLFFEQAIGRASHSEKDDVVFVDIKYPPLAQQLEAADAIKNLAAFDDQMPRFHFSQMDINNIGVMKDSHDVVISDFTLNFQSDLAEVNQMFRAAAKVLRPDGTMFVSVIGNPDFLDKVKYGELQDNAALDQAFTKSLPGSALSCYPLSAYLTEANKAGLFLASYSRIDIPNINIAGVDGQEKITIYTFPNLYGILRKQSERQENSTAV